MAKPFYNREQEQKRLKSLGGTGEAELAVVYGRRRCGKSTLVQRVLNGSGTYFLATPGTAALQRKALAERCEERFPGFSGGVYPDWHTFFTVLVTRTEERFTLCLDEFPYMVAADESLTGVLQALIDQGKLGFNIILCGSSQQMMMGLLDGRAPLFGRANEIMKVRPLAPGYLLDAFSDLTDQERIAEYAVWGGVPRYWELRRRYTSLPDAIKDLLLGEVPLLYDEPERLLLDDIQNLAQPLSILKTVASGANRLFEIGARTGRTTADLRRPLNKLIALGYIRRETPYGVNARKTKQVLYHISDPFMRFYFRFIAPKVSEIELRFADDIWLDIEPHLPHFIGAAWEELCRLAVLRGALDESFPDTKRFWGTGVHRKPMEIDFVGRSRDGKRLLVGECKWSKVSNEASLRHQLEAKARLLPFYQNEEIVSVIAGKSFTSQPTGLVMQPSDILRALRF